MSRYKLMMVLVSILSGCVYESQSLDQLKCAQEGQRQGDRLCQGGLWVTFGSELDLSMDMIEPRDMPGPPDMMDLGDLGPDLGPDMRDMSPDMRDMSDMETLCSNGKLDPGESCDDGNLSPNDGCDTSCELEQGWVCSSPGQACKAVCGDGIVIRAFEACDDNNTNNNDGCSALCVVDAGWSCALDGKTCSPVCGDGVIITHQEGCDDMNKNPGDGCSAQCAVESGYLCEGEPSSCKMNNNPVGNGVIDAGEECDDSNTRAGDGCDAMGQFEPGFLCPIEGYSCRRVLSVSFGGGSDLAAVGRGSPNEFNHYCGDGRAIVGIEGRGDSNNLGETKMLCGELKIDPVTGRLGWTMATPTPTEGTDNSVNLNSKVCPANELVVAYSGYEDGNRVRGVRLFCQGFEIVEGQLRVTSASDSPLSMHGYPQDNQVSKRSCGALEATLRFKGSASSDLNAFALSCHPIRPGVMCGDGIIEGSEACDDGNAFDGDGCNSSCQVEANYTCAAQIFSTGGDGVGGVLADNAMSKGWMRSDSLMGTRAATSVQRDCDAQRKQNTSQGKWIDVGDCASGGFTRFYSLSFEVPHQKLLSAVPFRIWADNNLSEVYLNNIGLGHSKTNAYAENSSVAATFSNLVQGRNTLSVEVQNSGGIGGVFVSMPNMLSRCMR